MPYVLGGRINSELPALWGEGPPYSSQKIYDINANAANLPPVNYLSHTLKPHSLTHIDAASHIIPGGINVEKYFREDKSACFFGATLVVKLKGEKWKTSGASSFKEWRVSSDELKREVKRVSHSDNVPAKIIITAENVPLNEFGYHDPDYILVLSPDAAEWLVTNPRFNAFGTSWKSSDYEPGSRERPVHRVLLRQAVLFEYLNMAHVPEGEYFMVGFPLEIEGASESPVNPVLFTKDELLRFA